MNVFAASLAGHRHAPQDESDSLGRSLRLQAALTLGSVVLMAIVGAFLIALQPTGGAAPAKSRVDTAIAALQLQRNVLRVDAALRQWAAASAANPAGVSLLEALPSGEIRAHLGAIRADSGGDAVAVRQLDQELASWAANCQRITAAVANGDRATIDVAVAAAAKDSAAIAGTSGLIADHALRQAEMPAGDASAATGLPIILLGSVGAALALGYLLVYRRWRARLQLGWQRLAREASCDVLTGAYNRRRFLEAGRVEFGRAQRHGIPLAVLIVDLDDFDRIHDRHGHAVAHSVLKEFSRAARSILRRIDVFGRLGERRFAILLPHSDIGAATLVAKRLREGVARLRLGGNGLTIQTTISVGVAQAHAEMSEIDDLMNEADAALREAQACGRDCVSAVGRQLDFTGYLA